MPRKPRVEVMERADQQSLETLLSDPRYKARLSSPFGQASQPIELKDNSRECRWVNGAIQNDHIWQKKRGGWDQVKETDLVDTDQLGGYNVSVEGFVTRGERGQEILMSMPKVVVRAIRMAKTAENNRIGRPNEARQAAVETFGRNNPDAAEIIAKQRFDIKDSHERILVTPEE